MQKTAREVIASGDLRSVVDFGIELDRRIKSQSKELEEVKEYLRLLGRSSVADRQTERSVLLEGSLGAVQVTYPADTPKARKGVDLLACEVDVPEGVWRALFVKRVVVDFARDFLEKLRQLSREDQAKIADLVEVVPPTPRVGWPR